MQSKTIYPLLIRRSLTLNAVFGVIFAGGTLILAWAIITRLFRGVAVDGMSWLLLLGLTGMAVWSLRDAIDRRVQVKLTAEGFTDRRTGGAFVPWSAVRKANGIIASGVSIVEFTIGPQDARNVGTDWLEGSGRYRTILPSGHIVRIVTRNLDSSSADILAFERRAAPHVEIPKKLDLIKGWVDG
jgi:hypothetical protein